MMRKAPLLLLLCAAAARAASVTWGPKDFGVVVLGPAGGTEWIQTGKDLGKALGPSVPLEAALGEPGTRSLQRALDRLQQARVRRIVVVPFFLDTSAAEIEQAKYILGIQEFPSRALLGRRNSTGGQVRVRRALAKVPLVMTSAIDGDPAAAEALLAAIKSSSRAPGKESLVLVGRGEGDKEGDEAANRRLGETARGLQKAGGFRLAVGAQLQPDAAEAVREKAERALRDLVRNLGSDSRVIVVSYTLSSDGSARALKRILEGLFCRVPEKGLLPHPALVRWAARKAVESRDLPGMVRFKDAGGRALPPPERKRIVK